MNPEILGKVTEELRKQIAQAVAPSAVVVQRPATFDAREANVCLHLHDVTRDVSMRNEPRGGSAPLTLHFVILTGGYESRYEPHRLLGQVIASLDASPVLASGARVIPGMLSGEDASRLRIAAGVEPGVLMCKYEVRVS